MAKKNAKNKVKFKWTKELIILIVGLVAIIVATVVLSLPSSDIKKTEVYNNAITEFNSANSTSYATLDTDNVFERISDVESFINDTKGSSEYVYVFYGLLTNSTTLEQLSNIDTYAKDEEIDTVYFFEATWYNDNNEETESFNNELTAYNDRINEGKEIEGEFDLASYPAILIFHNGNLVFCTQEYDESSEYNWSMYVNQAFRKFTTAKE